MNDDLIVTIYVVIDEVMQALAHRSHRLAHIGDAEVLTVAVVAAKYFGNNHNVRDTRGNRTYATTSSPIGNRLAISSRISP